jgi:hypothetical protein
LIFSGFYNVRTILNSRKSNNVFLYRFEEPEAPGSRSFFTEIIASISDIKFGREGRYLLSRDYMTLKVCNVFPLLLHHLLLDDFKCENLLSSQDLWFLRTWCFKYCRSNLGPHMSIYYLLKPKSWCAVMGHQHGLWSSLHVSSAWIFKT